MRHLEQDAPAEMPGAAADEIASIRRYLRLIERCLCRDLFPDGRYEGGPDSFKALPFDEVLRQDGRDWPISAETMVGMKRLANVEDCCLSAIRGRIPGDFVETGVWRGGCAILMRAVIAATGDQSRDTWLFDSFEGLPKPDAGSFPKDKGLDLWMYNNYLAVSLEDVSANFARYDLLDERTRFIRGWFRDTIPNAPVNKISVLRLDGDLYESTWMVLTHLYPKLSPGGFVIVDDYGAVPACKAAVDEFRAKHWIGSPITQVDWTGVFWRKKG